MAEWIKWGRQYDKRPVIGNTTKYATQWHAWWTGLQPAWRGIAWPLTRMSVPNKMWDKVRKGGKNGFLMILLSLGWWISAAENDIDKREVASAIEDVEWVMGELTKEPRRQKWGVQDDEQLAEGCTTKRCE